MTTNYPAVYNSGTSSWTELSSGGLPEGGSSGQVLIKNSNTNYDVDWINQSQPNRNLLINGAMQVHQRGTSVSSTSSGGYKTVDRWKTDQFNSGNWSQTVETTDPTNSGFRKSVKILCDSFLVNSTKSVIFTQIIEGQNLQSLHRNGAGTPQLTISFWVKSNATGTYIVELYNYDTTRSVSASYTINSSAIWEKKTITFPVDGNAVYFNNDNGSSLGVNFWITAGSLYTTGTLATSWGSVVTANRAVGQRELDASEYWQITGVQLEEGSTASPFEFKPYSQELLECQRYYHRWESVGTNTLFAIGEGYSSTQARFVLQTPVVMRSAINVSYANIATQITNNTMRPVINLYTATNSFSTQTIGLIAEVATGISPFYAVAIMANNTIGAYIAVNAEL